MQGDRRSVIKWAALALLATVSKAAWGDDTDSAGDRGKAGHVLRIATGLVEIRT